VFYGSVFSDILDQSYYGFLFVEAGRSFTTEIKVSSEIADLIWNPIEEIFRDQAKKAEDLRKKAIALFP
jgi:hypothetical protein